MARLRRPRVAASDPISGLTPRQAFDIRGMH